MWERWLAAINDPWDRAALAAAVTEDIVVDRHKPGRDGSGEVGESFRGLAAVGTWLSSTPQHTVFGVVRELGHTAVEYRVTVEDFTNTGEWHVRVADDGRISHLSHRPHPLPPATLPES